MKRSTHLGTLTVRTLEVATVIINGSFLLTLIRRLKWKFCLICLRRGNSKEYPLFLYFSEKIMLDISTCDLVYPSLNDCIFTRNYSKSIYIKTTFGTVQNMVLKTMLLDSPKCCLQSDVHWRCRKWRKE